MSKETKEVAKATPSPVKIQVKYEDLTARYSNHVLVNTANEEVYLDFSSGILPDQGNGVNIMPIHTRIAMTPAGLKRFYQVLGQLFDKQEQAKSIAEKKS